MKFKHFLVLTALLLGNSVAKANEAERTLSGHFFQSSQSLDVIHHTPKLNQLLICKEGKADNCRVADVKAEQVLPINSTGTKEILVISNRKYFKRCKLSESIGTPILQCSDIGIINVAKNANRRSTGDRISLAFDGDISCTYTEKSGLICASARAFNEKSKNPLVFGSYTKAGIVEVLDLQQLRICSYQTGKAICRRTEGLELVFQGTHFQSAAIAKTGGRSTLAGIGKGIQIACGAFTENPSRVGFTCNSTATIGATDVTPYVVTMKTKYWTTRETISLVPKLKAIPFELRQAITQGTLPLLARDSAALRGIARDVHRIATQAMRPVATLSTSRVSGTPSALSNSAISASPMGVIIDDEGEMDPPIDEADMAPDYFEIWVIEDDSRWEATFWSDELADERLYATPRRLREMDHANCVQTCDAEQAARNNDCTIYAGWVAGIGLSVTTGVSFAMLFMPAANIGAGAFFLAGSAASATFGGLTDLFCKAAAAETRNTCGTYCRR